jgi:hypothetical protein
MKPQGTPHQPNANEINVYGSPLMNALSPGRMKKTGVGRLNVITSTDMVYVANRRTGAALGNWPATSMSKPRSGTCACAERLQHPTERA